MVKLNKNDKVKIISNNKFWNNKIGTIVSEVSDENLDNILVKVILDEENNRYIVETFSLDELELASKNENLIEKLSFYSEEEFKNYFIGKSCKFLGLDYNNIYAKHEEKNGDYTFNDEDLEEITYYESLKSVPCIITDCALINVDDDFSDIEDSFNSSYWDLEFENDEFLSGISGLNIKILDLDLSMINENLVEKQDDDYIKNYVYAETFDSENIPSWFFVNKIADAENKSVKEILKIAKNYKYKCYKIEGLYVEKLIVAAPDCDVETIKNDYSDYLLGDIQIKEVF